MYQPELEAMPRKELQALQLRRLRATLQRVQTHNSGYAARLGAVTPADLRVLADVRRFPFLSKEDIRRAYPFGLACAPQRDFVRMQMSSGTTGTPVICPHTAADVAQWSGIMARCLTAAGITPRDVIQITPSFGLFNGGFGFHYGASAIGAMIVPIGAGRTSLQLQFLRDLGATAIAAIASYPLRLIEVAQKEGLDFRRDTHLRVGVFGAEVWSAEMRRRIEAAMGIESFDIIGMTETAGVGLGIDCAQHNGIHVWEDHYLVEIVDPESGEPLPDGETGEMILTTLTREALPLIRFRTHDLTRVLSRDPCPCGRTSLRVDRIACRTDDMLKVKGVNFYPAQVESVLLKRPELGNDYLIVIERLEGADRMTISVEAERPLPAPAEFARALSDEVYDLLGLRAGVNILRAGELHRPEGKAVRVQDRRT